MHDPDFHFDMNDWAWCVAGWWNRLYPENTIFPIALNLPFLNRYESDAIFLGGVLSFAMSGMTDDERISYKAGQIREVVTAALGRVGILPLGDVLYVTATQLEQQEELAYEFFEENPVGEMTKALNEVIDEIRGGQHVGGVGDCELVPLYSQQHSLQEDWASDGDRVCGGSMQEVPLSTPGTRWIDTILQGAWRNVRGSPFVSVKHRSLPDQDEVARPLSPGRDRVQRE